MKVLLLHNRYRQDGGEDAVFQAEAGLLESHGVEVVTQQFDNNVPDGPRGGQGSLDLALGAVWSRRSHAEVVRLCEAIKPDVAHVHNFWMRLSPAVHHACHTAGVPTVQSLHNFRLLCVNAVFLREGRVCEDCLGKIPWRGVVRRCYRNSSAASSLVAAMAVVNRARDTWNVDVDAFIALSEHARAKFIAGGLPSDRIFIKPNCTTGPPSVVPPPSASNTCLYAGRLSPEKGLEVLIAAWADSDLRRHGRLLIAGDGPSRSSLEKQAAHLGLAPPNVVFLGRQAPEQIRELLCKARCTVLPSLWYEGFPMAIAEAFAYGRPAVVSCLGSLPEIVTSSHTGLTFPAGDSVSLGRELETLLSNNELADRLGENAREEHRAKYTPDGNYPLLMKIYRFAIERRGRPVPKALFNFIPAVNPSVTSTLCTKS